MLIELDINEVRDVMFYGFKILVNFLYEKIYDLVVVVKFDK